MSFNFSIRIAGDDGERHEVQFDEVSSVLIGRGPECDVVLPSAEVSRFHARISAGAAGVHVEDQSSNGTFVGDTRLRLSRSKLEPGMALKVGPYSLSIEVRAAKAPLYVVSPNFRRSIHRELLDHLDLACLTPDQMSDQSLRPRVVQALEEIVAARCSERSARIDQVRLVLEMTDEVLGLGPLQELLDNEDVSEVMVVDPETIYVETDGQIRLTPLRFMDDESCRAVIERIVTPLGRRIDESTPLVDARLPDGSRVNAIIPPLAIRGPCITIRKFARRPLRMEQLVALGAMSESMAVFLERCVRAKKNMIISGGTGSGKTTLLNVLSSEIPANERIVTIEDAAELQLDQPHVVSLESKPPNIEGRGAYSIRDLLKNALRMRPDRIVVGECRGGEAIDMLQAMNTGHEGSMTTTHANSAEEALKRVETLCMMAGLDLSPRAIREQIASSVHIVVQQTRFSDGSRRITSITEVDGLSDLGELILHEIFHFKRAGVDEHQRSIGAHRSTGYVPSFLDDFIRRGLVEGGAYL